MPDKLKKLKWQMEMGADEAIGEVANNRFETKVATKLPENNSPAKENDMITPKQNPAIEKQATLQSSGPQVLITDTRNIAENCQNLAALKEAVYNFKGLSITKTATNTVFADGNPEAEIMLVGEAPGAEEDAQGIPFCGASGKLLDQMLSYIGLVRKDNFYITNTIFWRPPGNRRPTPEELAICLPFVEKHIALVKPKLIILVGGTAVAALIDSKAGITKLRGQFMKYGNTSLNAEIPTTAIFHPSYLLRSPGQKRIAWQDLLSIKDYIRKNGIKI